MADLADLAEALGETEIASANRARAGKSLTAMERLWSEAHGQYLCLDRITGKLVDSASVGGILPAFAAIPPARAATIAATVGRLAGQARHVVPSHDPDDPRFDAKRYWRGPVWLVVNYMIADGLAAAGHVEVARRIMQSSPDLITESGVAEYYDPLTGAPLGGGRFTWTAAMVIEFLGGR